MGDDELDEAAKLKIATNFINYSPPGQIQKVVEDVRVLLGGSIPRTTLEGLAAKVNSTSFLAVAVPGCDYKVLITPFGDLGDGTFLDPQGQQRLTIDHGKQVCTSADALSSQQTASLESKYRDEVDMALKLYAAEKLPGAVVTTYSKKTGSNIQVTSCIGRCDLNLNNYWAGLWRSHWVIEFTDGSKSGSLKGTVHSNVHYFEDGNVQLDDSTTFKCDVSFGGKLGDAVAEKVLEFEMAFNSGMETIYNTMSESVLQGLRRRLPVTRVKFDWDNKASVHKLASELQRK
jgi:capping protein alpha